MGLIIRIAFVTSLVAQIGRTERTDVTGGKNASD